MYMSINLVNMVKIIPWAAKFLTAYLMELRKHEAQHVSEHSVFKPSKALSGSFAFSKRDLQEISWRQEHGCHRFILCHSRTNIYFFHLFSSRWFFVLLHYILLQNSITCYYWAGFIFLILIYIYHLSVYKEND